MSLLSWGNYPRIDNNIHYFYSITELQEIISNHDNLISYGNGRSYGDSALNKNLIYVKPYNYILGFDPSNGILHCRSGLLLSEILEIFIPKGWFLSITPGTKYITVGGAIASDVHGKNHHVEGSFSSCVEEFELMLPSGEVITCSTRENNELFYATCGGMGLTGVMTAAKIKLKKISSNTIDQIVIKSENLKHTFELFEEYKNYSYSVAWIDCLAKGKNLGRSILTVGEHSVYGELNYQDKQVIKVPFEFPSFTLNKATAKIFNTLYYGKFLKELSKNIITIDQFFYPLDTIGNWNRIYGKNGFTQYQFVIPLENSYDGFQEILSRISEFGKGTFLAVLKLFGKGNKNWLSFPFEGYTLALDFKIEPEIFKILDELDKIILKYGGRFYLTKDVRINKSTFEQGYDNIDDFRELRKNYGMDKKFNSLQSIRLGL